MNKEIGLLASEKELDAQEIPETPWNMRGTYMTFEEFINGMKELDDFPARDSKNKS